MPRRATEGAVRLDHSRGVRCTHVIWGSCVGRRVCVVWVRWSGLCVLRCVSILSCVEFSVSVAVQTSVAVFTCVIPYSIHKGRRSRKRSANVKCKVVFEEASVACSSRARPACFFRVVRCLAAASAKKICCKLIFNCTTSPLRLKVINIQKVRFIHIKYKLVHTRA